MCDFARWPEWTPTVSSIKFLDPEPIEPGKRLLIRQPRLPPAIWKMIEIEPGRSFDWMTTGPGVRVRAHHGVEPAANGSHAWLSLRFQGLFGGLVARLTRRLNEEYLQLEANGLRNRCENS